MTLDSPDHAPETTDGTTTNEMGVVSVYRVKALRGGASSPKSNFIDLLSVGPEPNRGGA